MIEKEERTTLFRTFRDIYKRVLGFEEGADIPDTIASIKRDISFRGHVGWILVFSILICSIGLNTNSPAVVIGAMLISPLMGPILGVGLAVGTQDYETLNKSLKNWGIAVGLSLITATIYFLVTPLNIASPEILARTKPTFLDVMVALFGGFAGIIASSRKEKSNVVPGVAIATALMPPLCSAGFGLSQLRFDIFLGALYLFFINSVFISLSTFLVVRYLKFPVVQYLDATKLRRYRIALVTFIIIVILPSTIIFYNVIQETRWQVAAERYVQGIGKIEGSELLDQRFEFHDTASYIHLYYFGKAIAPREQRLLEASLPMFGRRIPWLAPTKATRLEIHQSVGTDSLALEQRLSELNQNLRLGIVEELYERNEAQLADKDQQIALLEAELRKWTPRDTLRYVQVAREIQYQFPEVERYSYGRTIETHVEQDSVYKDTIPVFLLHFREDIRQRERQDITGRMAQWLRVRFNSDKIRAVEY